MITDRTPLIRGVAAALIALLASAACSGAPTGPGGPPDPGATGVATAADAPGPGRVLLLGDSVAVGQARPMAAAFDAGGVEFRSLASDGGGNVVGPFAEERWTTLPGEIAAARPDTVIYQITTYDWGSEQDQRAAYRRLLDTVTDAGAELVFVTMPPIRPDEFYRPHLADLERTPAVARAVADDAQGRAVVLDAAEVWGQTYRRTRDGVADRSTDGIHTCPQGAARFTDWLLTELAERHPAFTPPAPEEWANTGWSADGHFQGC